MRSSVFIRRLASWSFPAPPPSPPSRSAATASISSRNTVLGAWCLASSKSTRTSFSESPRHFETIELALMLKNVVPHSVATAFASMVLPVPGGRTAARRATATRALGRIAGSARASRRLRAADVSPPPSPRRLPTARSGSRCICRAKGSSRGREAQRRPRRTAAGEARAASIPNRRLPRLSRRRPPPRPPETPERPLRPPAPGVSGQRSTPARC